MNLDGMVLLLLYITLESVKGNVISSYFWGYIIPQIAGGIIAMKCGARYSIFDYIH